LCELYKLVLSIIGLDASDRSDEGPSTKVPALSFWFEIKCDKQRRLGKMKAYNVNSGIGIGANAQVPGNSGAMSVAESGKQPQKKFRAGPICATVWSNEGQGKDGNAVSYSTVSLDRSYKDKSGEWQKTSSMRVNDLPRAALVATKAYEYLVLNQAITDSESYA
jgi:hypothetical protein